MLEQIFVRDGLLVKIAISRDYVNYNDSPIVWKPSPSGIRCEYPFIYGEAFIDTGRVDSIINHFAIEQLNGVSVAPTRPYEPPHTLYSLNFYFVDPRIQPQFHLPLSLVRSEVIIAPNVVAVLGRNALAFLDVHFTPKTGRLVIAKAP